MLSLGLATPQALDLLFAVLSLAIFSLYHAWYYSWHLTDDRASGHARGARGGAGHHRLDRTGQTARQLFTLAVLASGSDADLNLAVQTMRYASRLPTKLAALDPQGHRAPAGTQSPLRPSLARAPLLGEHRQGDLGRGMLKAVPCNACKAGSLSASAGSRP